MAKELEPVDLNQDVENALSQFAEIERKKLFPKNNYNLSNQYSSTNPDALATGDEQGKGTGNFLDVDSSVAGNNIDNVERKMSIKINKYNKNKFYPDF